MDRDSAISRIANKVGFRTDINPLITTALQDVQDELERSIDLPWFLTNENTPFVINPANPPVATPQEYPLPTGFIRETDVHDGNLRFQQTAPGPTLFLEKMDLMPAENYFFGRRVSRWNENVEIVVQEDTQFTPGTPMVYVLRENTVRIYPGPDKQYTLTWDFFAHDTALNGGNVTNQWLTFAPWLLISKAGLLVATDLKDTEAVQYFSGIEQSAMRSYAAVKYEREVAGRRFAMGRRL
jgi:hypothetical protein